MAARAKKPSREREKKRAAGRDKPGEGPEGVPEPPDAVRSRMEWFHRTRVARDPKATDVYLKASIRRHKLESAQASAAATAGGIGSVNWTPIGPSVIQSAYPGGTSGRITSLAVGPGGNRVYAGAANGGVWFSPDAGASWTPLDDYIVSPTLFSGFKADSLSVGALAVRFGGSAGADEVFVGTGEANGPFSYAGIGVRHLVGAAWSLEGTNLAGRGIFSIVIDPDDLPPPTPVSPVSKVYAATTAGLFKRPPSGSVASWTHITSPSFTDGNGPASDFIAAGNGASKMFYAAFYGDRVYSSPDAVTWTAVPGLTTTAGKRIALAASESSPGDIYALLSDASLYRLSGNTFYAVPGLPASTLFSGGQGTYDIALAVSPTDPNTILIGGDVQQVFKGAIAGGPGSFVLSPTWVGKDVHPDIHAITFGLNSMGTAHDPSIVWVGTDGGPYQSLTGAAASSFKSRNLGLAITELNSVTTRADTAAVVFAGAQDNGAPRLLSEQAAVDTERGDAGGIVFDPLNPYRVMLQVWRAYLWVSADGGTVWSLATFPPALTVGQEMWATEFVAPLKAMAGGGTSLVAFGTNRLWLSANWGSTWITLPTGTDPYAATTPNLNQDVIDGTAVEAIAFASPTRIFAATFNTVWRYDFAAGAWSKTALPTTGLPATRMITSLAADLDPASASGSVYATLGLAGSAHCYYFNGTAWLPAMPTTVVDVPSHAVVVDPVTPTKVYVGTDVGCFQGTKSGLATWSWVLFSQGLPEAAITGLEIFAAAPPARLLRAVTYGRGVWEIDLSATIGLDPELYLRVNYADDGRLSAAGSRFPWVEGAADPTHVGYTLYHWMSADIKVRRTSLTGLPPLASTGVNYLDYATNIGDYVDTTWQAETADATVTDRIFVEVHNRSLNAVNAQQVSVLLLQADASAGLPNLPANWAAKVNAADTSPAWLAGSGWAFVDAAVPYRNLNDELDVRTPRVVEYQSTFGSLNLPMGHEHVCMAAFVTAPNDLITSALVDLNQITMTNRHVAHRNIHLVGAGLKPISLSGKPPRPPEPETFVIDFHNPTKEAARFDLIFDRRHFPGHLSVVLPKLGELANPGRVLQGFRVQKRGALDPSIRKAFDAWLENSRGRLHELESDKDREPLTREWVERRIRGLRSLEPARSLVADDGTKSSFNGIKIPALGRITAAITIRAPERSRPGRRFRLDVLQRDGDSLVGGSTYVIVVIGPRKATRRDASPARRERTSSGNGQAQFDARLAMPTSERDPEGGRFPDLRGRSPVLSCGANVTAVVQHLRVVHVAVAQAIRHFQIGEDHDRPQEVIVSDPRIAHALFELGKKNLHHAENDPFSDSRAGLVRLAQIVARNV